MNNRHATSPISMNRELRSGANTRITGCWLFVARLSFVVVSIFYLVLFVIGTPVYFAYLHTLCTDCLDDRLTPDKLHALQALNISITTYAVYWVAIKLLFALVYFAVAALIFWRKSDDWMAWLAAFSLVAFGASFTTGTLVAMYAGCIVGLQALLRGLFNQTSEVVIVISTLVIAALSQPLRKRIQAIIKAA